ncbi:MAG: MurR/RpiR family transcriptional regulator [Firmicutes bacterium]|nr:MurR/RpiR family transcriptional regulator [Bacillota bacterium]
MLFTAGGASMRLEEVVNKYYEHLNENDLYILKVIFADKKACVNLSINELAERCNVSRTTILRFAQKLGFSGYSEFKVFLSWQEDEEQTPAEKNYVQCLYDDIDIIRKNMGTVAMEEICQILHDAKRVFVYGTGAAQKEIGKEMQRTFLILRKYLHVIEGETELENVMVDMDYDDVVIIISCSGNRSFLKDIVHTLQIHGVKYMSMTNLTNNFLAQNTKYNLYVPSTILKVPTGILYNSTALFFIVADILFREYIAYVEKQVLVEK